jgi:hypothetical protein
MTRRFALRCARALALAGLLLPAAAVAEPAGPALTLAGKVVALEGTATVARVALPEARPLVFKDDVYLYDRIATGEKSITRLLLGGKASVTVREHSLLHITEVPGTSTVNLTHGRISVAVSKDRMKPGETVEIRTPNAIAAIRGTVVVAEVEPGYGGRSTITVLRGLIDVVKVDNTTGRAVGPAVAVAANQSVAVTGAAPVPPAAPIKPDTARQLTSDFTIIPKSAPAATTDAIVRDQIALAKVEAVVMAPVLHETAASSDELQKNKKEKDKKDKKDARGESDARGEKGARGEKNARGGKDAPGEKGATGEKDVSEEKAARGEKNVRGDKGTRGEKKGATGEKDARGERTEQNRQGPASEREWPSRKDRDKTIAKRSHNHGTDGDGDAASPPGATAPSGGGANGNAASGVVMTVNITGGSADGATGASAGSASAGNTGGTAPNSTGGNAAPVSGSAATPSGSAGPANGSPTTPSGSATPVSGGAGPSGSATPVSGSPAPSIGSTTPVSGSPAPSIGGATPVSGGAATPSVGVVTASGGTGAQVSSPAKVPLAFLPGNQKGNSKKDARR